MAVRFDPTARRAIDLAMVEVESRGHTTLDTLHLLIGLLDAKGGVAAMFQRMNADPARIRKRVGETLGQGTASEASVEVAGITEEILQGASNLSRDRGADTVSDVDILYAMMTRGDTAAVRVLQSLGVTRERLESGAPLTPWRARTPVPAVPVTTGAPALPARVGIGYDSHRFVPGGPLRLGGIDVPHDARLAGHSDGDAIAHALTDAILGACGQGDIGEMFPDSDPANRGRDSLRLLEAAVARARDAGWLVAQADITVIAEQPRLAPHRGRMKEALCAVLGIPPERLGLKGKTNEGMGWIGTGEGLACIAVATLVPASAPARR